MENLSSQKVFTLLAGSDSPVMNQEVIKLTKENTALILGAVII